MINKQSKDLAAANRLIRWFAYGPFMAITSNQSKYNALRTRYRELEESLPTAPPEKQAEIRAEMQVVLHDSGDALSACVAEKMTAAGVQAKPVFAKKDGRRNRRKMVAGTTDAAVNPRGKP